MKESINEAINELAMKSSEAGKPLDAMQFSQAVLNLVHAKAALHGVGSEMCDRADCFRDAINADELRLGRVERMNGIPLALCADHYGLDGDADPSG